MKNRTLMYIAMMMTLLLLTGCAGQKTETSTPAASGVESSSQSETSSQQETQQTEAETPVQQPTASEVTQNNLSTFSVTDEAMFATEPVDGGVSITSCADKDSSVIVVPDTIGGQSVVAIGDYAFSEMTMQGVVLPDTVEKIGYASFILCADLKYIDLGSGLESINSMAFNDCHSLERIEFPEGMTTFYGVPLVSCESLADIVVPGSVTELPKGIVDVASCPNAVVITPAGSAVEADCIEYSVPYRNS